MKKYIDKLKTKRGIIIAILIMAAPAIIEMALNTILGVADMIMIGQMIGSGAIASVGFSNQIMYFLIFTFSAFNTGAVAMISRAYGEKDLDKMKRVAEQNVVLNLIIGLFVTGLAFALRSQIFSVYDIEPEILSGALAYFNYVLLGFVPMFLSFSFASILRGSGDTKTPMWITGIANFINIIGNYVLITGWGIFPELGIAGAAISTSFSRAVATSMYIYILYVKPSNIKLKVQWIFEKKILGPLFKISLPGGLEQFFMQLSFVVVGIFIAKLDTDSEALFRILIQIESLSFMPAVGISIAVATLVGKSLGEKDIDKASEIGTTASFLGILWGVLVGFMFVILPLPLLYTFTTNEAVITLGIPVMIFMAFNQPGLNYMIVMGGALRGAGDTYNLMIYTMIRLWGLFVPFSYLFILTLNQGVAGLWQAEIFSILATAIIISKRFKSKKWAILNLN